MPRRKNALSAHPCRYPVGLAVLLFTFLQAISTLGCNSASNRLLGMSMPQQQSTSLDRSPREPLEPFYAGRATLMLPPQTKAAIGPAEYDLVDIASPGNALHMPPDRLWEASINSVRDKFGKGKPTLLATDFLPGTRSVLYNDSGDFPTNPNTAVRMTVWKTLNDNSLVELSAPGIYNNRQLLQQLLSHVSSALSPMGGPIDSTTFVTDNAILHLAPDVSEGVNATYRFNGYTLSVTTVVYTQPLQPKPREPQLSAQGVSHLRDGAGTAGPFRGTQGVDHVHSPQTKSDFIVGEFVFPGVPGGSPKQPTIKLRLSYENASKADANTQFLRTWDSVLSGFSIR